MYTGSVYQAGGRETHTLQMLLFLAQKQRNVSLAGMINIATQ